MSDSDFDVLIVGGGLIGISLARALAGAGLAVAVIDAVLPGDSAHPSYDDRAIALSLGSMRILAGLKLAATLRSGAAPIRRVHVSDRGHFGFTRMDAEEHGLEALGYVTDARTLGAALNDSCATGPGFEHFCPARPLAVTVSPRRVQVRIEHDDSGAQETLGARLLVGADGAGSPVRGLLGMASTRHDYGQAAVTANITPSLDHRHTAYERFTDTGPMAALPMTQGRCGVIWTMSAAEAEMFEGVSDEAFAASFVERFGSRLGQIQRVGKRGCYPLNLVKCEEQVRPRVVLVGNAAHTLHPVAGQGLNLGLRDVAALAETLLDTVRAGGDPGHLDTLSTYQDWRGKDQREISFFTDALVRLFALQLLPVTTGRNLGLLALDLIPVLKRGFVRKAVGLAGRQSRLARGLAL